MIQTIVMAAELSAYTLTDYATYIKFLEMQKRYNFPRLFIAVNDELELKNNYKVLFINPKHCSKNDNLKNSILFKEWLSHKSARDYIAKFELSGKKVFFFSEG